MHCLGSETGVLHGGGGTEGGGHLATRSLAAAQDQARVSLLGCCEGAEYTQGLERQDCVSSRLFRLEV